MKVVYLWFNIFYADERRRIIYNTIAGRTGRDIYYSGHYFGVFSRWRGGICNCADNFYFSRSDVLAGGRGAERLEKIFKFYNF